MLCLPAILLRRAFPNPFNPTTTIGFQLPVAGHVTLTVHDVLGRQVAALINQNMPPGYHEAIWNARDASSGVYLYQLRAGSFVDTRKIILLR
jgi:glucuronoarabinoxylan endo-1,4-beta-xylanase